MASANNFQDWENIVFTKKSKEQVEKEKKSKIKLSDETLRLNKIDSSDRDEKHKKIEFKHSQLIQKARLIKKMTQKQLAQKLYIDINLISQYESGKIVPNRQILNKLAKELNISFK